MNSDTTSGPLSGPKSVKLNFQVHLVQFYGHQNQQFCTITVYKIEQDLLPQILVCGR